MHRTPQVLRQIKRKKRKKRKEKGKILQTASRAQAMEKNHGMAS
jgi:hypothetical protein